MANIFSGLEGFGLKNLKNIDVFEEEKKKPEGTQKEELPVIEEKDLIFDKTFQCPVCDTEYKDKVIRTNHVKLLGTDTDLRPRHDKIDTIKYDICSCPRCGFTVMSRYFNDYISNVAIKNYKEQVGNNFRDSFEKKDYYDYNTAITRYKLCLLSTVVKNAKASEKAYVCLKTAWMYRGKREEIHRKKPNRDMELKVYKEEVEFLSTAYEGFVTAYQKETFPICGMDKHTVCYLIAELARRINKKEEAKKWVAKLLSENNITNKRIKERAVELKQLLSKDTAK